MELGHRRSMQFAARRWLISDQGLIETDLAVNRDPCLIRLLLLGAREFFSAKVWLIMQQLFGFEIWLALMDKKFVSRGKE